MPLLDSAHIPLCTYRVQLNGKFTFADVEKLTPYFRALGVSDLYLSPIFTATPGSLHGYDVTDYSRVNAELGGADGFGLLAARLRREGCSILLDFVPNHMGIAGMLNQWWRDVLASGRFSPYAPFFDIQWKDERNRGRPRVLVPVLADHYGKMLEEGKITLTYDDEFLLHYTDISFPINPSSYAVILKPLGRPPEASDDNRAVADLVARFKTLPKPEAGSSPEAPKKRAEEVERLKKETAALMAERPRLREKLIARLKGINGTPGDPGSFEELHTLIERQHYRLARWKTGAHEINYRRFFAIDSLVGLHVEKIEVFRECHEMLSQLVREGKVAGLRIDHIDGLRQPEDYLRRIQSLGRPDASKPLYVLVEKILARGEPLPDTWPVQGTTGYEFIPSLADLFVDAAAETRFDESYRRFTGESKSYAQVVYEKKRMISGEMFVNAISNFGAELVEIVSSDRRWRDLTRHELTTAVSEFMTNLPVYRTYRRNQQPASPQDRAVLEDACARAIAHNPRADPEPFEFMRDLLVGAYPPPDAPDDYRNSLLNWVLTFQQYSGAVMAKSVEDTAFYVYDRLVALNEVGGDPGKFGGTIEDFHRASAERQARSPLCMLATSTHDTKLSEDVRARLYALSELPDEWETWLRRWQSLTDRHTTVVDGFPAPDSLDVYRFYQILLGTWPLDEAEVDAAYRTRLREHFRKAVSEAKRHTSILQANNAYFEACDRFVDGVATPESAQDFMASFIPRAQRIARLGMVNSLAQLVLKCTVPGVPDFYQGNEVWDFSMVDPDNRRDVDYARREKLLALVAQVRTPSLLENWRDGRIKLRTMQILLQFRSLHSELFSLGAYRPVAAKGGFADRVVAFTRIQGPEAILVVVPRLTSKLGTPPLGLVWDDTRIPPENAPNGWRDLFTDRPFPSQEPLLLRELFAELPFAVLQAR